jgi:hypothetical protein
MAEHWMQGVAAGIKKRGTKGVFKRAAEHAGESTAGYASKISARNKKWRENHPDEKMPKKMAKAGKRAGLAKAFSHASH